MTTAHKGSCCDAAEQRSRYLRELVEQGATEKGSEFWGADPLVCLREANNLLSLTLELLAVGDQALPRQVLSSLPAVTSGLLAHVPGVLAEHPSIDALWEHCRVWSDVSKFHAGSALLELAQGQEPDRGGLRGAVSLDQALLERGVDLDETRRGLKRTNYAIKSWACGVFPKCLLCDQDDYVRAFTDQHFNWPTERGETSLANQTIKLCFFLSLHQPWSGERHLISDPLVKAWRRGFLKSLVSDAAQPADTIYMFLLAHSLCATRDECGSKQAFLGFFTHA